MGDASSIYASETGDTAPSKTVAKDAAPLASRAVLQAPTTAPSTSDAADFGTPPADAASPMLLRVDHEAESPTASSSALDGAPAKPIALEAVASQPTPAPASAANAEPQASAAILAAPALARGAAAKRSVSDQAAAAIVAAAQAPTLSGGGARRTRFDVRLDEGDLGRIDVRLDISHDGRVATRLVVDRAETFNLLRQDAGELSRSLEQAGFQLSGGGLSLELRDGSSEPWRQNEREPDAPAPDVIDEAAALAAPRAYATAWSPSTALDVRV